MIYLNLTINNPWSDRFENVYVASKKLTKYKAWEFQIYRSDTVAEFETRISFRQDHAGVKLGLGLFGWTMDANIYDTRHWNYAENRWEIYD